MASANIETSLDTNDDNHQAVKRRESKKRKFRPFSAVRKLFGGGKNKRKSSGDEENQGASATKDRPLSTPVCNSPGQDRLGNKRHASADYDGSVTEGSVTSPERKEAAIVLTQSALSDANVPKSTFQAELAGKLNKRRSFCSEEDEEDGLRQGLAPPVLATDDTTENSVQEDLFHSRWSSAVSSPVSVSGTATVPESHVSQGSVDLSTMVRTELLRSDAAKDRISVKPRTRKSQSRKTRQGRYSLSLPSLVEVDSGAGGGGGGGQTPHPGVRPRSEYIDPSVLSDVDLTIIPSALSAVELASPQREQTTSPTQPPPSTTPAPTPDTPTTHHQDSGGILNIRSQTTPTSPPAKTHRVSFATDSERVSSSETVTKAVSSSPVVKLQAEKDDAILKLSESSDLKTTDSPEVAVTNGELNADTKSGLSSVPESSPLSADKKDGLRQTDRETDDAFSPKPDYKIRRQQRSKTLPAQQSVITVQRTASQRDGSSSGHAQKSPEKQEPTSKSDEPDWIALARRKTQKHNEESSSSPVDEAAPRKPSLETGPSAIITITTKSATSSSVATTIQSASMSSSALSQVNTESKTPQSNEIHNRRWQSTKTLPTYLSKTAAAASTTTSTTAGPKTTPSLIRVASPQSSATVIKIENTPALSALPQASSDIPSKPETTRPLHSSKSNSLPRPRSRVEKAFSAPHWQTELIQRTLDSGDVKIELIESKSSSPASTTSGKKEAESSSQRQFDSEAREMTTDGHTDQCRTSSLANKRHSRVMDLLKNFENLQSVS